MIRRKGMAWVEFNNDVYSRNKVRVSKVIIAIIYKMRAKNYVKDS